MEKISFQPLADHLKEQAEVYNTMVRHYEMTHGTPDPAFITGWIVEVTEPVIRVVASSYPERMPQVFKAMFSEMLRLMGNRSLQTYEMEYRQVWSLLMLNPMLVSLFPERTVLAISHALESIHEHQPGKGDCWLKKMSQVIPSCQTLEEMLECGRLLAWTCGMAHLRNRVREGYKSLREGLQQQIQAVVDVPVSLEDCFQQSWPKLEKAAFLGEAGGFTGHGGVFGSAPYVARIGEEIVVCDHQHVFLLFADHFGKVLLPAPAVSPADVLPIATVSQLDNYIAQFGRLFDFKDITSCVVKDRTLVLTRSGSHYLFLYGCPS